MVDLVLAGKKKATLSEKSDGLNRTNHQTIKVRVLICILFMSMLEKKTYIVVQLWCVSQKTEAFVISLQHGNIPILRVVIVFELQEKRDWFFKVCKLHTT